MCSRQEKRRDHLGLFVVTAGDGVRDRADAAKQRGEFVLSHILHALALETAEAAAEWVHRHLRAEWGFPDPETMTMQERWTCAVPRQAVQLRLSRVPESRRSAGHLAVVEPGRHRRPADRRIHDGTGGERQRARLPSSRLLVFRNRALADT